MSGSFFTSPLAGEVGPRSGPGEGGTSTPPNRSAPPPSPHPSPIKGEGDITRRALITGVAAAALAPALPRRGLAQDEASSHGMSIFGDLKYGPEARHFDYVNPSAPKGGHYSSQIAYTQGNQTFDTFNTLHIHTLKGEGAAGMPLTFDSLMARALDEPDSLYGLVAQSVARSSDGLTYRFTLRPEARFHDGSRITARDVAFSLMTLKEKGHPRISQTLRFMAAAEAEGDAAVVVRFAPERSRDLPLVVAAQPIFSEAWWRGRDFEASTLEPPLGSGPYKVARFEVGRFVAFERVKDYWAQDLLVRAGQFNFDEIRFEYYRDRQVALEGFKAGAYSFREEFTSRDWVQNYDFPALREGRVKREELPDRTPSGTQGWFFNTRRDKFKDPRIREAIGLLFDFEWTNSTIMFSTYRRTASFFENSGLKASGQPSPEELKLLEPWRGKVPEEVFGEPFSPPKSDGSGQDRALFRRASELLREAGCKREGNALKLPGGQPFEIEFLDYSPALQPHTQPFIRNLGLIGIQARSRIVDAAQYQRRTNEFDFDVVSQRFGGQPTPGEPLRAVYGSRAAATKGSQNLAGVADPAVDALIEAVLQADSRAELTTACRALDRVLRAGRYWVPMWYNVTHRLAYWDQFGRPDVQPTYGLGAPDTWWFDADKARRIGRG
jgi:microcin C transport system substrate-binding protein